MNRSWLSCGPTLVTENTWLYDAGYTLLPAFPHVPPFPAEATMKVPLLYTSSIAACTYLLYEQLELQLILITRAPAYDADNISL